MVHLVILAVSLLGFVGLAAASERHSALMLPNGLTEGQRKVARISGWVLLAAALTICFSDWGFDVGSVAWLGGLTIVAAALAFYLPRWPWQPVQAAKPARKGKGQPAPVMDDSAVLKARNKRRIATALLIVIPVFFGYTLWDAPVKSTMRADAYHGQVGPWAFSFAEAQRKNPKIVAMDVAMKDYYVRFCEACDTQIRAAYLKVNKPRSLRGAGMSFSGARWDRWVDINLPQNAKSTDLLWLTVEGKDGSVHYASIPLAEVSPKTAKWLDKKNAE